MGDKYHGMYLGIVVQNNDPDRGGKIKVFVPHISASVYENWVQVNEDKKFKFPGTNIDSDLSTIIEPLKAILPWAECAMPLVGASGSGRYNAHTEVGTVSDSARLVETIPDDKYKKTKYSQNDDGIGESPGRRLEKYDTKLTDAFNDAATGTNNVNILTHNYTPSTYSNTAKGSFSIPNVGSHVWVFFKDGNATAPVYFAASFGESDWQGIYDVTTEDRGNDYPGTYENISKEQDQGYTTDTETYRNKYVINQKGGALEFVNTDNREILKMTHFSGSFKEFNNKANIELATENDQKLVLNDQFETVRGFKNSYVQRDYDFIVRGDRHKKIGNLDVVNMSKWRNVMSAVGDIKQLFETQRANANDWTSELQLKEGCSAPCPVCNPTSERMQEFPRVLNEWLSVGNPANTNTPGSDTIDCECPVVSKKTGHQLTRGVSVEPKKYTDTMMSTGMNCNDSTPPGMKWKADGTQEPRTPMDDSCIVMPAKAKAYGLFQELPEGSPPIPLVGEVVQILPDTSAPLYGVGAGYMQNVNVIIEGDGEGACAEAVVAGGSIPFYKMKSSGTGYTSEPTITLIPGGGEIFGEKCPVCGGTGISPSSMDGLWMPEEKKQKEAFEKVITDAVEELVDVERELGLGGNELISITKHKIETIGTVMNDFGSIRKDVVGKLYNDKVIIHKQGVFESKKETPLIEYVHVDDLPGGTYTLNVCNKYTMQVGAGGLSMKTYGPVDISGTVVNTAGEQVNISSSNEVNIDGGKRLSIVADIISLRQRRREQVLIDSSLGINRNLIVAGSSHFEGEVYLHHVTAPCEIQETQNTRVYGRSNWEEKLIIGYIDDGTPIPTCEGRKSPPTPVYSKLDRDDWYCGNHYADHDCSYMYPHSHYFKNLPLHLKKTNDSVRSDAKECNATPRGKTRPREWVNAKSKAR